MPDLENYFHGSTTTTHTWRDASTDICILDGALGHHYYDMMLTPDSDFWSGVYVLPLMICDHSSRNVMFDQSNFMQHRDDLTALIDDHRLLRQHNLTVCSPFLYLPNYLSFIINTASSNPVTKHTFIILSCTVAHFTLDPNHAPIRLLDFRWLMHALRAGQYGSASSSKSSESSGSSELSSLEDESHDTDT